MRNIIKFSITAFFILSAFSASALEVQYGTTISTKGSQIIESFNFIGTTIRYLCSVTSLVCQTTQKTSLGTTTSVTIKKSLQNELKSLHSIHITQSPNKKYLAYSYDPKYSDNTRTLVIRNSATNKTYTLSTPTPYWDLTNEQAHIFAFSPDNKTLVHLDDRDGYLALYQVDLSKLAHETFTSAKITTSALTIVDFLFSDSHTLYYIGNAPENPYVWSLYRLDLQSGKQTIIESNLSYVDPLKKIGSHILFNVLGEYGYVPEMYNTATKKLESFTIPGINSKKSTSSLIHQEVINTSEVKGVLMHPDNENKTSSYPLVIWLHGGPYRQTSYGYQSYHSYGIYDTILESLRKNGVMVLKLDYRGSLGFGRAYSESIKGSIGDGDVTDVTNALAYMQKRYHITDTYLMGNSYGGYLSLRALVEHPTLFTGVVSINGVTDWASLTTKLVNSIFNTQFDGIPNELNKQLYDKASITSRIGNLGNQKIDIIAGVADRTIPVSQATTLYDTLKQANKNVTLITYPGEDHVYKQKKTIVNLCNTLSAFVGITANQECNQ